MSAVECLDCKNMDDEGQQKLIWWLIVCSLVVGVIAIPVVDRLTNSHKHKALEFSINGAYLTRFNYIETNHTLSYNLSLNITLTNPYKGNRELFETQVTAYYQNKRFGIVTLIDKRTVLPLEAKNTTIFQNAVVQGWKALVLEEPVLPNVDHLYSIDVVITFQEKIGKASGKVMCNLNVPLSFNGTSWDGYKPTKCSRHQDVN